MSRSKRKSRLAFDPAKEAQSLYFTLLNRGEYVPAASLLNRLLGTSEAAPSDDASRGDRLDVSALSDAEYEQLGRLLEPLEQFKSRVRQRLDLDRLGTERRRVESRVTTIPEPAPATEPPAPSIPTNETSAGKANVEEPFQLDDDEVEIELEDEL